MDTIGGSVAVAVVVGAAADAHLVGGVHHCPNSEGFHRLPMNCYQQNVVAAAGNWPHDPVLTCRRDDAAQQPVVAGRGEGMIMEAGRARGTGAV